MSNDARSSNRAPIVREPMVERLWRMLSSYRRLGEADKRATVAMLAANLAHNVGTPLNVIRGRAEHLLRREQGPPRTIQELETIIRQVDKIFDTVRALLALGRQDVALELRDARELVTSSAELMQPFADRRHVAIKLELDDVPLLVRCDPDQLQQIFINLISNALDATGEEDGALRVCARPSDDRESRVRLAFEARGSDVAYASRALSFDPFSKLIDARGTAAINLMVAQWIARDHNGEISFELTDDGAYFLVNLPLAMADTVHQSSR
jgi:signal transduction histidine kinase